jgi:hypothetical protein
LPITYHIGPGSAVVHLALKFDWASRPLYDVVARIPGTTSPDQLVIYGNHHDAWVNGAGPRNGFCRRDTEKAHRGKCLESLSAAWLKRCPGRHPHITDPERSPTPRAPSFRTMGTICGYCYPSASPPLHP